MRLATVLTPMSDENLTLAAQCGVTDVVGRYPGPSLDELVQMKEQVESYGMRLATVEGYLPIENLKLGRDDGTELAAMKTLLRNMRQIGIPILCYNFMAGTDWVRTRLDSPERGGAKVTAFSLAHVEQAMSLNLRPAAADAGSASAANLQGDDTITADQLWRNLEHFLRELIPVAEEMGVTMCMHPDDPPLMQLHGKARIMNSVENFERLVNLVRSPSNAICFCQGTFAAMGCDIPASIRRLGPHIKYVHFRDVRGTREEFVETFHDNGPTDMAAAMRAYRDIHFDGPMRPDHVPQLYGEDDGEPGYTMLGRLFAYGYMRGLMHAVATEKASPL
ncbi:MAG: mannonate dehydratase [Planctomycetaceae bacterium]